MAGRSVTLPAHLPSLFRSSIGKVVAESKYAANVTGFTSLIKKKDSTNIRVLLTNTTQEDAVMQQASTAASGFSNAWITAGASEPSTFSNSLQTVTSKLFRELIDVTTDIEVQYVSFSMSFFFD